jgi:hypothetical protein
MKMLLIKSHGLSEWKIFSIIDLINSWYIVMDVIYDCQKVNPQLISWLVGKKWVMISDALVN